MLVSFQGIPRHPDTRFFEVREAFKLNLLLVGFRAYIRACMAMFCPPAALPGGCSAQHGPRITFMSCYRDWHCCVCYGRDKKAIRKTYYIYIQVALTNPWSQYRTQTAVLFPITWSSECASAAVLLLKYIDQATLYTGVALGRLSYGGVVFAFNLLFPQRHR